MLALFTIYEAIIDENPGARADVKTEREYYVIDRLPGWKFNTYPFHPEWLDDSYEVNRSNGLGHPTGRIADLQHLW